MADDTGLAQYNGSALVITSVIFLVLTWISVALRTYVRGFLTKSFQLDDWLMLVAQVNFTLSCAFILVGVQNGLGRHNAALPQQEEIEAIKWQALATATYIPNMMFIKLSIGVFLLRLAVQRRYKWTIWISMGVVFIWATSLFFWDIFQCRPVQAQWDYTIPGYTCVSAQEIVNAAYALSVLNIVTDWLYALLPIPMIWNAKMTMQAKLTVGVILSLGIFASVATLIRVKFLSDLTDTNDILYAATDAMVWTLVEPGVAIIASSLVTIRPLLREWRLKGFESSQRSRSNGRWARYGRSKISEIGGDQNNGRTSKSKTNRSSGVMPGMGPDDDIRLKQMEAGYYPRAAESMGADKSGGADIWSHETTITSCTSIRDCNSINTIVNNNNGREPHAGTGRNWAVDSVREEDNDKVDGGVGDNESDLISHLSWPSPGPMAPRDSDEGLFRGEGSTPRTRGRVHGGKTVWRSGVEAATEAGTETPNDAEEPEIQGLRPGPGPRAVRAGEGPWPFS